MESAASGSQQALDSTAAVSREAWKSASVSAAGLMSVTQGILASTISADLDSMLAGLAKGPATIYDKAMDAGYLATNIGGGNHRLFDGGHTIAGAFQAVRGASTEESIIQEGLGFVQGMFRDLTTSKGLPLANWDKATYDQVAGFMESRLYVGRDWFYDLNSYTSAELVGGSIGILAVVFQWNRADTESFSRMVGSMGVAAVISANPLLLVIMVVAFARGLPESQNGPPVRRPRRWIGTRCCGRHAHHLRGRAGRDGRRAREPILLGGPRGRHPGQQGSVSPQRSRDQPIPSGTGQGGRSRGREP